mmetsp:Transcript_5546/g.13462  ORF Transcript_5546/g.13462 Transcript_5546/m.13462 type:complete len:310 (+) Transcript_5546:366-1295(+)
MDVNVGNLAVEVHEHVCGAAPHLGDVLLHLEEGLRPPRVDQPLPARFAEQLLHPVVHNDVAADEAPLRHLEVLLLQQGLLPLVAVLSRRWLDLLGRYPGPRLELLRKKLPPPDRLAELARLWLLLGLKEEHLLSGDPLARWVARVVHNQVRQFVNAVCLAVHEHVREVEVSDDLPLVPVRNLVRLPIIPPYVHRHLHAQVDAPPNHDPKAVARLPPPVQPVAVEERQEEAQQPPHQRHRKRLRLERREPEGQLGQALRSSCVAHGVEDQGRGAAEEGVGDGDEHQPRELQPDGPYAEDGPPQVRGPPDA